MITACFEREARVRMSLSVLLGECRLTCAILRLVGRLDCSDHDILPM